MEKLNKNVFNCFIILILFMVSQLYSRTSGVKNQSGGISRFVQMSEKIPSDIQQILERPGQKTIKPDFHFSKNIVFSDTSLTREVIFQEWSGAEWESIGRYIITWRRANEDPASVLMQLWNGLEWENVHKVNRTFSPSDQLILTESSAWHNNEWIVVSKRMLAYDDEGTLTEEILMVLSDIGEQLKNHHRTLYYYDVDRLTREEGYEFPDSEWIIYKAVDYIYYDNGELAEKINSLDLSSSGELAYTSKFYYTYYASGQLEASIWQHFDSDDHVWRNTLKTTWQYLPSGDPAEILEQVFDGYDWVNFMRTINVVNPIGSYVDEISQEWGGAGWLNIFKIRKHYDEKGNNISDVEQIWDGGVWKNENRETREFDENNRLASVIGQNWEDGQWVNDVRWLYNYAFGTSVNEDETMLPESIQLGNYPNPFNPSTTIQISLPSQERLSLRVYDLRGRLIKTLADSKLMRAGVHAVQWDGTDQNGMPVPSGLYFYRAEGEKVSAAGRCLLIK